ncbi:putative ABC transport system permease component [Klebsiella pneumoniae]|uniref:Putative ABC transport system permease component n=1 Tax=Klebsiella pneumoniae TaxID=573 RepID=A0A377V0Z5_KLEPN|nr:putative ABC transport system permease component [Klebsiella pneumoniae]
MNKEYILLARAKGAGEMTILLRHVLPNIRGTLLTVTALAWTSMLEGAVLTRNRLLVAGDRPLSHHGAVRRGYHGDHGRHAADRREFCADQ